MVLTGVDDLIAALERTIAKKQAITQGIMQQLLTGKTRLPGFTDPWRAQKLEEFLMPRTERHVGGSRHEVLTCTKHEGFVRSLDYFKNQVFSRNLAGYRVIRRGDIGYPANHVEEGSIGVQDIYDAGLVSPIYVVLQPRPGVDTYFLQRQLKLESYRQAFARVTNASVNRRGSLRWPQFSQVVATMPSLREQHAVSEALRGCEDELRVLNLRLVKERNIQRGMMQELMTGRKRLPVDESMA